MLWLGLLARDTGIPTSRRLGIKDDVLALDFDLAISLRLFRFDNEAARMNRIKLAAAVWGKDIEKDAAEAIAEQRPNPFNKEEELGKDTTVIW